MSHEHYQTRALVIDSRPSGEASALVRLYTRELGMVAAVAQGLREGRSKLRGHLQPYVFLNVSLVRGREWWRLVGAEASVSAQGSEVALTAELAALLKQLVHGEEKNEALFDDLEIGVQFAREFKVSTEIAKQVGAVLTVKTLYHLGYLRPEEVIWPFVTLRDWSLEVVTQAAKLEPEFASHVALSLTNAQL